MDHTRRDFLGTGAAGLGGTWLALQLPSIGAAAAHARESAAENRPLAVLTEDEARQLEAIAARIIPTDDTPGAREAGVIRFIDRAFETFQASALPFARQGLSDLRGHVRGFDAEAEDFAALPEPAQDEILRRIENEGFFGLVRYLTVVGMFALPEHGGNQDKAGWRVLGFEDRFRWAPPFGYYDAEARDG